MRRALATVLAVLVPAAVIAAVAGISTQQTRTAAPGAVNLSGVAAAEGSSLAHARADHTHSLTGTLAAASGGTGASNTPTSDRYLKGNGTAFATSSGAASGTGSCTNQFVRALNSDAAPTCATVANADLANSSLTVTAGTGLTGGGAVSLGGSTTLNLSTPVSVANGGTNKTSWSTGSVAFAASASALGEDNTNLFWDNTSKRLGLGTSSPSAGTGTSRAEFVATNAGAENDLLLLRNNDTTANTATTIKFTNSTVAGGDFGSVELSAVRGSGSDATFNLRVASGTPTMTTTLASTSSAVTITAGLTLNGTGGLTCSDTNACGTCTSSASTTCTATVRSGCKPLCSQTTSVSTELSRCSVSSTTLTCTWPTSGTNTCNFLCF